MKTITRLRRAVDAMPVNARAVLLVLGAAFLFASSHAGIRHLTAELHPFVVAFFRNFFAFAAFAPWFVKNGFSGLRTNRFGLHFLRALVNTVAILLWFSALGMMAFADATALSLTGPLFAVAGAVVIMGERVGAMRWSALALGVAGALVVIRPGLETVSLGAVLVLLRGMCQATTKLMIKSLTRTDETTTIVAYVMLLMLPMSLAPALFVWQWPEPADYGWLIFVGAAGAAANMAMVTGYKLTDVSIVEPVTFTRLMWAALIGYLFFAEVPDIWIWLGGAMIVAAASYLTRPVQTCLGTCSKNARLGQSLRPVNMSPIIMLKAL